MFSKSRIKSTLVIFVVLLLAIGTNPLSALAQDNAPSGELTVWVMGFDPHVNGWQAVADGYMAQNPNATITVEAQGGQADMLARYKTSLSSGSGADIFTAPGWDVYEWAVTGQILPLSPEVMTYDEAKATLFPEYILQAPIGDQLWALGIPDPPGDAGIIVNLGLLEAAGLEYIPQFESTEQMLEYARALTEGSGPRMMTAGLSFQEDNAGTFFLSYIVDQGGVFWDNDTQTFDFTTPEAVAAAEFLTTLYAEEGGTDNAALPPAIDGMLQGSTAMAYLWPEFMPFAAGAAPENRYGFIMKPAFSGTEPAYFGHADTWNAVIPNYVADKGTADLAYDVMRYLASEEGQLLFLDQNPGLSPLRSLVFENAYYTEGKGAYLQPLIEAMRQDRLRYYGPFLDGSTIQYDILWANIQDIILGNIGVEEGLQQLTDEANARIVESRASLPDAPDTIIYFDALPSDLAVSGE